MKVVYDTYIYDDPDCLELGKKVFWESIPHSTRIVVQDNESRDRLATRIMQALISHEKSIICVSTNAREVVFRTYHIRENKWFVYTYFKNLDGVHSTNPYGVDISITLRERSIHELLSEWVMMSLYDPLSILND
jgi:hypothetical protein